MLDLSVLSWCADRSVRSALVIFVYLSRLHIRAFFKLTSLFFVLIIDYFIIFGVCVFLWIYCCIISSTSNPEVSED